MSSPFTPSRSSSRSARCERIPTPISTERTPLNSQIKRFQKSMRGRVRMASLRKSKRTSIASTKWSPNSRKSASSRSSSRKRHNTSARIVLNRRRKMPKKSIAQRNNRKDSKCKRKSASSQKKPSLRIATILSKIDWIKI